MIPRPSTAHADGNGGPPAPPFPHLVWITGGTFLMGSNDFYPEERPVHRVTVDGFWMDDHPVTNAEFRRFVKATGYRTVAERPLNPGDYPGVDARQVGREMRDRRSRRTTAPTRTRSVARSTGCTSTSRGTTTAARSRRKSAFRPPWSGSRPPLPAPAAAPPRCNGKADVPRSSRGRDREQQEA